MTCLCLYPTYVYIQVYKSHTVVTKNDHDQLNTLQSVDTLQSTNHPHDHPPVNESTVPPLDTGVR